MQTKPKYIYIGYTNGLFEYNFRYNNTDASRRVKFIFLKNLITLRKLIINQLRVRLCIKLRLERLRTQYR